MGYLRQLETASSFPETASLSLNDLVAKLKSTPDDKSVTIDFPVEVGKLVAQPFAKLLVQIDMEEDIELTYTVKSGILKNVFNVKIGGINSEVKKALLRVLRYVQSNTKSR